MNKILKKKKIKKKKILRSPMQILLMWVQQLRQRHKPQHDVSHEDLTLASAALLCVTLIWEGSAGFAFDWAKHFETSPDGTFQFKTTIGVTDLVYSHKVWVNGQKFYCGACAWSQHKILTGWLKKKATSCCLLLSKPSYRSLKSIEEELFVAVKPHQLVRPV